MVRPPRGAGAMTFASRFDRVGDRTLATLIGAVLFALSATPLAFLRMPPYQDLPDHLSTVCVLLDPARYPEYVSNGFLKANSLLVFAIYGMARVIGVIAAGKVFTFVTLASTAFVLPHFVLSFTDRRRLLVASLVMAPMVHNWWTLMGMLNFAFAFPMGLLLLMILRRQILQPTAARSALIALMAGALWYAHGIVMLLVALLASIEAGLRPADGWRAKLSAALPVLGPMVPVGGLIAVTVARHALTITTEKAYGKVSDVFYQDNFAAVFDLWGHWWLGMSYFSAAGLVTALVLAFFAARDARARVPFFSPWALGALLFIYFFFPNMMPGFGYVDERAMPFLWMWALVRVPSRVPRWLAGVLATASLLWAAGTAWDLIRGERDLDEFTAAAPEIPDGEPARLLTLDFASQVSSHNTWSLLHASGMYTVLRGAHPQDLWADSASMPIRHTLPPSLVEDPVRVRDVINSAPTPKAYCESLQHAGLPDYDCEARYSAMWRGVWEAIGERYDYVLVWGAPKVFESTFPGGFTKRFARGKLTLLVKTP